MRTLWVALTTCLFVLPGHAKYSGGSGTTDDPYQIATVADLLALGSSPEDYSRHFVLMADIDLDPNLPGRRVFGKAVIAPGERAYDSNDESHFVGVPFTGVFDGNDHVVSHLVISGTEHLGLFGQLASGAQVKGIGVVDVRVVGTGSHVGALAGSTDSSPTQGGVVVWCYSTGVVQGTWQVGGLVPKQANAPSRHGMRRRWILSLYSPWVHRSAA